MCHVLVDVFVEDEGEDGEGRVDCCVAHEQPVLGVSGGHVRLIGRRKYLVQPLGLKVDRHAKHSLANRDNKPAVHDKLRQLGAPLITIPSVPDQQFRQVAKLRDGEIRRKTGLPPLLAHNADAHVGGLDHADVVATVANAADALARKLAYEARHVCFLRRGAAARDDGGEEDCDGDKVGAHVREEEGEGLAVDEEACVWFRAEKVEVLGRVVFAFQARDGVDVLAAGDEFRRDGDAAGRLDLVAREHPDFDAGVAEELERGLDVCLELVLDARDAEELEVLLEVERDDALDARVAGRRHGERRGLVRRRELGVLLGREAATANDKSAQALARHVCRLLVEPVVCRDNGAHDGVGALLVEPDFPGGHVGPRLSAVPELHNDSHALSFRREWEYVEDADLDDGAAVAVVGLEDHGPAVARGEAQPDALAPAHNGNLVGRRGLV